MIRTLVAASIAVAGLVLPFLPSPVLAVDVINQDDKPYFLIVVGPGGEEDVVVGAHDGLYDVCAGCVIRIDGVGDVKADDASILTISGGKARVELIAPPSPWRGAGEAQPARISTPPSVKAIPAGRVF